MGACTLGPNARPPYARPLAGTLALHSPTGGMGSEGLRLRGLKKRSAARRHVALWFPFSEHKYPSRRRRALLCGNRAEGAARGAGRQESRVLTLLTDSDHLTEGKDDVSAGTLSECPSPKGRECPPWRTGGASDGKKLHRRSGASVSRRSLRISDGSAGRPPRRLQAGGGPVAVDIGEKKDQRIQKLLLLQVRSFFQLQDGTLHDTAGSRVQR
jgi:hypothetical protein